MASTTVLEDWPLLDSIPVPCHGPWEAKVQLQSKATASLQTAVVSCGHGKATGQLRRCRAKCREDMGSLCPVVKRSSIFCGLTVFSSAGLFSSVFTCAIWGTRLLTGAKGFLAPFFQLMPLTGEADTLGAPILQLKPSVVWIQAPKVFILLIITAFNKIEVSGSFPLCPVSFVIKRFPGTHHPCVPTLVGPALGTGIWSPCLIN